MEDFEYQKFRDVPLWKGRNFSYEKITGGLTNNNYRVTTNNHSFFARISKDIPAVGVYRSNEIMCHKFASSIGIAPKILHVGNGITVTEYVEGVTVDEKLLIEENSLVRISDSIRSVHKKTTDIYGEFLYFCPYIATKTYLHRCHDLGVHLPYSKEEIMNFLTVWKKQTKPGELCLMHGDLRFNNIVIDNNDDIAKIVDWEYAGIGTYPLFDLACLSCSVSMDAEQDKRLLSSYFQDEVDENTRLSFLNFKTLSFLKEALWGTIQRHTAPPIVDYNAYANSNFEQFKKNMSIKDRREHVECF